MRLAQRIDSLKGKPSIERFDKKIVISSSGLITTIRTINSERWTYLRALSEKARDLS
jgi:hypothetical protein